jgi:hypothetical protein
MSKQTTAPAATETAAIDMEKVQALATAKDYAALTTYLVAFGPDGVQILTNMMEEANRIAEEAKKNAGPGVRNIADSVGLQDHPSLGSITDIKVAEKSGQWRVVVNGKPHSSNRNLGAPILVYPFRDLGKGVTPSAEQQAAHLQLAMKASLAAYAVMEAK